MVLRGAVHDTDVRTGQDRRLEAADNFLIYPNQRALSGRPGWGQKPKSVAVQYSARFTPIANDFHQGKAYTRSLGIADTGIKSLGDTPDFIDHRACTVFVFRAHHFCKPPKQLTIR